MKIYTLVAIILTGGFLLSGDGNIDATQKHAWSENVGFSGDDIEVFDLSLDFKNRLCTKRQSVNLVHPSINRFSGKNVNLPEIRWFRGCLQ